MVTPRASGIILRSGANSPQSKNSLKQTTTLLEPGSQSPHLETTIKKDSVGIKAPPLVLEPRTDPSEGIAMSILVTGGSHGQVNNAFSCDLVNPIPGA